MWWYLTQAHLHKLGEWHTKEEVPKCCKFLFFIYLQNQSGLYKSIRTDFPSFKRNNHLYTKCSSGRLQFVKQTKVGLLWLEAEGMEGPGVYSKPGGGFWAPYEFPGSWAQLQQKDAKRNEKIKVDSQHFTYSWGFSERK